MRSNTLAARAWYASDRWLRWLAAGVVLAALSGCQDMYDQHRYEPFEASTFFEDGASSRPLVAGTVPRTDPRSLPEVADRNLLLTGLKDGQPSRSAPFPVDQAVLERGQGRYRIYCAPCHGEVGDGKGIIVQRGFTPPPSYHDDRLRDVPLGHFFQVISQGHGAMYSFAARIAPQDRWAVASYIRALQLSQNAKVSDLPPEDQGQLQEALK
jgi:mono/diheme cytochrome c family protein